MTRSEIDTLLARHQQSFASQSAATIAADHVENGTFYSPAAGTVTGRAEIQKVYEYWLTAFPDMVLTMDSVRLVDAGAEYFWTFQGTNSGPGGSGQRVKFSGYEEWTLSETGLIARSLGHFDEAEYNHQLQFGVEGG